MGNDDEKDSPDYFKLGPNFNRFEDFSRTSPSRQGDRGFYVDRNYDEAKEKFRHYGPHGEDVPRPDQVNEFTAASREYTRPDAEIEEDVRKRLHSELDFEISGLEIKVVEEKISLAGQVEKEEHVHRAEEAIFDVIGPKHLENRLSVKR